MRILWIKSNSQEKAVITGVNSKSLPLNLRSIVKETSQKYLVTAIAAELKRFSILFLYSLKKLANGIKPTIKVVLVPFMAGTNC